MPGGAQRQLPPPRANGQAGGGDVIEAERRPLVTYSDGSERAWAARIEKDELYEPRPRSRAPLTAAAAVALVFLGAFFGGREAAVAAIPDLASLYAAIGLPVNLRGLALDDVAVERSVIGTSARLTIRGAIRNTTGSDKAAPPLATSLRDSAGHEIALRGFDAPTGLIAAGASVPFLFEVDEAPRHAVEVVVRFRRPAEDTPAGGAGKAPP